MQHMYNTAKCHNGSAAYEWLNLNCRTTSNRQAKKQIKEKGKLMEIRLMPKSGKAGNKTEQE